MLLLKYLKQNLQEFTKLPVIIDSANVYKLQEIRLKPQKFKLGKQEYKAVYYTRFTTKMAMRLKAKQ